MRHRRSASFLLVALLLIAAPAAAPARSTPVAAPPDLDAVVSRAMRAFEVPGMAVAVVRGGEVLAARGYGVRTLGEAAPVDGRTVFGIASNTKVFTATALALLVDEGRLAWDHPVVRSLPWFQMWDPFVTRELTVRDLLVHRSGLGLGAGDLLWWPASTYDRKEIARRLRHLRPATSFRSAYAYDNVLYTVAGEVIEAVSGLSWEDFVTSRILAPVGMRDSSVLRPAAERGGNLATPHALVEGRVRPVAAFTADNTNPGGGIDSTAEDMARWLAVLLAEGALPGGGRLFSAASARELTTLVTPMPIAEPSPELAALTPSFRGYALGLVVEDYLGKKLMRHGGLLPGYASCVTLVPEAELGVAVLTNQESSRACRAVGYHVVDHALGAPAADWVAAFQADAARQRARSEAAEQKTEAGRDAGSRPSLPLEQYAGTYTDAWYGDVVIEREGPGLVIRFSRTPALRGDLRHWQHDTFVARWRDRELRADAFVTFALTPEGGIDQVKMRAVSPDTDFSFDFHDLLLKPAPSAPAREAQR